MKLILCTGISSIDENNSLLKWKLDCSLLKRVTFFIFVKCCRPTSWDLGICLPSIGPGQNDGGLYAPRRPRVGMRVAALISRVRQGRGEKACRLPNEDIDHFIDGNRSFGWTVSTRGRVS